jgi:hypothetical protein
MKFIKGQHVRQRGKHQVMEVKGEAGLTAGQYAVVNRRAMVACEWRNAKGRVISRAFPEIDLEPVASPDSAAS